MQYDMIWQDMIWYDSKKFRTGPFEQTPQDLKTRRARARAKMKPKFFFFWRARARRVLGLEGSVQKVLFEISLNDMFYWNDNMIWPNVN